MRIKFQELFSIHCLHDYFTDHICSALRLRPTAECSRLLERYKCLFRPTAYGGAIYYGEDDEGNNLGFYQEDRPFSFTLTSSDPFLELYTDMDVSSTAHPPAESFYYFNNLTRHVDEIRGEKRSLLHPPGEALASSAIAVKPTSFRYDFAAPRRAAELKVVDAARGQVVWEAKTPSNAVSGWSLELASLSVGSYTLEVDGESVLEFYLSDKTPVRQWGLVEIFPGGKAMIDRVPEDNCAIDADGQPVPRSFAISLSSRKTVWRYHIINGTPDQQAYDDYMVVGTRRNVDGNNLGQSKEIPFTRTRNESGNGEQMLMFESQQDIPLRQLPSDEHFFSFKTKAESGKSSSALKLPYAQAKNTKLDAESGARRMYSDIFVYL